MNRDKVYELIDGERAYQNIAWRGHTHEVGSFLTLIRQYSFKADTDFTEKNGDQPALAQIRKIAALCVACMEQHGAPERSATDKLQAVWDKR